MNVTGSHMVPLLNNIGTDAAALGVCFQCTIKPPSITHMVSRIMTWTLVFANSSI